MCAHGGKRCGNGGTRLGQKQRLSIKKGHLSGGLGLRGQELAPRVGFEPTTLRLTAACSTIELPRKRRQFFLTGHENTLTFGAVQDPSQSLYVLLCFCRPNVVASVHVWQIGIGINFKGDNRSRFEGMRYRSRCTIKPNMDRDLNIYFEAICITCTK